MKSLLCDRRRNGRARPLSGANGDYDLQVPALERGLAVIELPAKSPAGLTLAEINDVLRISGASVFRIATALEELGYVQREAQTKRFALTRKLLLLGQPRSDGRSLVESSIEPMRRVLAETGETTQLCCLAGEHCVVIEQLPSLPPFKYRRISRSTLRASIALRHRCSTDTAARSRPSPLPGRRRAFPRRSSLKSGS